jgi:hypothetical protein
LQGFFCAGRRQIRFLVRCPYGERTHYMPNVPSPSFYPVPSSLGRSPHRHENCPLVKIKMSVDPADVANRRMCWQGRTDGQAGAGR